MKILKNRTAAVTGAASGMGRMLAVRLAEEGCHLALADMNEPGLQETVALVGERVRVTTHIVDVARREQVFSFADEAVARHGGVDLIINNAGVALGDLLDGVPLSDFEWIMGINFWGVVYGTMAFLPYLKKRQEGHIVNVSSIYGILPMSNTGCYCASKFAVRGYTETLAQEMHGTPIRVSCVYPGGIRTNIARNARVNRTLFDLSPEKAQSIYEERLLKTTADDAAKRIISGIRHNKIRILVGSASTTMDVLMRLMPATMSILTGVVSRRVAKSYADR